MPAVSFKKPVGTTLSPASAPGRTVRSEVSVTLPTMKNKPSQNLHDYSMLIYGERKIGKTTLVSQFPEVLYLSFEPGAKGVEQYVVEISQWEQFLGYVDLIVKGGHPFKTICVDTGGVAYDMALAYACKIHGFDHPGGQNDFGQSWNKVKMEFVTPMRSLLNCGIPLVIIGHEQEKEIETRSGRKFIKMRPNFAKAADEFFTSQIDNVFYYHYDKEQRWLQIEGDEYITAGHRIRGHFLSASGDTIFKIPMGKTEMESYKNLMAAFNNKQKETFIPEKKAEVPLPTSFKK